MESSGKLSRAGRGPIRLLVGVALALAAISLLAVAMAYGLYFREKVVLGTVWDELTGSPIAGAVVM